MTTKYILKNKEELVNLAGTNFAFFAGSFNPPHQGHLLTAELCLKNTHVDYVIFCPHSLNPRKQNILESEKHRRHMLTLLFKESHLKKQLKVIYSQHNCGVLCTDFLSLSEDLKKNKKQPHILCGEDALGNFKKNQSYREQRQEYIVKHLPHIIKVWSKTDTQKLSKTIRSEQIIIIKTKNKKRISSRQILLELDKGKSHPVNSIDKYIHSKNLYQTAYDFLNP
jgi:nicotinate (nicotinamide) nucleotide adenylyltransferase